VDFNGPDLPRFLQAHQLPGFPCVGRFKYSSPRDNEAPDAVGPRPGIYDTRIRISYLNGPHGARGELTVGDGAPGVSVVGSLPHASTDCAHVEGVRMGGVPRNGGDAPAARGTDITVLQTLEERRLVHRVLLDGTRILRLSCRQKDRPCQKHGKGYNQREALSVGYEIW